MTKRSGSVGGESGIVCDTTPVEWPTQKKLKKIVREIEQARRGIHNVRGRDLRSIAKKLGRRKNTSRGKEPTWEPHPLIAHKANIISIPDDVRADGTKFSILDDLQYDADLFQEALIGQGEAAADDDYQD